MENRKISYLGRLTLCGEERRVLEEETRHQCESPRWHEERRKRLTASHFGPICKMRDTTSCKARVKAVLYPKEVRSDALEYGRLNEGVAFEEFEAATRLSIRRSGLVVSNALPFLVVSPDAVIDD